MGELVKDTRIFFYKVAYSGYDASSEIKSSVFWVATPYVSGLSPKYPTSQF
jgi:hypothetical protein